MAGAEASDADDIPLSWGQLLGPEYLLPTVTLCFSISLYAVNLFVFASLAPSIVADLGELERLHWATTLYVVASIISSAAAGQIRARFGVRRAVLTAVCAFALGSAVVALSPSMTVVLVGRAVQGLGSGLLMAGAHGLIRDLFPKSSWSRMFAVISGVWGIAAFAGPLLGGVFAALGEWRWGFFAMLPLCGLLYVAVLRTVPASRGGRTGGSVAPTLRLALIGGAALAVGSAGRQGEGLTALTIAIAVALLLVAMAWERRATDRLFPHGMFRPNTVLGGGVTFVFFIAFSTSVTVIYGPYFLTTLHGVPPLATGYVVTAQSISWTAAALVVAGFVGLRARLSTAAGPAVSGAGMLGCALFVADGPLPAAVAAITLIGAGIGMAWSHVAKRIFDDAGEADRDRVTSVIPTTQALGIAFGSATAGIVADRAGLAGTPPPEVVAEAARLVYYALLPAIALAFAGAVRNAYGGGTTERRVGSGAAR